MALVNNTAYSPQVQLEIFRELIEGAPTVGKNTVKILQGVQVGSIRLPILNTVLGTPISVCDPTAPVSDAVLTEKVITMNTRMLLMEDCYNNYQTLFNQQGPFTPTSAAGWKKIPSGFEAALLADIVEKNKVGVEKFIWNANSTSIDPNFLVPSVAQNGFLQTINLDPTITTVLGNKITASGPIDSSTILAKLNEMYEAASVELQNRIFEVGDVYIWLPAEYQIYVVQAFSNNVGNFSNSINGLNQVSPGVFTFMGINLIFTTALNPGSKVAGSWGNGTTERMVMSYKENMFIAVDVQTELNGDANLRMIDLSATSKKDAFLLKGQYSLGMNYLFGKHIVSYSL